MHPIILTPLLFFWKFPVTIGRISYCPLSLHAFPVSLYYIIFMDTGGPVILFSRRRQRTRVRTRYLFKRVFNYRNQPGRKGLDVFWWKRPSLTAGTREKFKYNRAFCSRPYRWMAYGKHGLLSRTKSKKIFLLTSSDPLRYRDRPEIKCLSLKFKKKNFTEKNSEARETIDREQF